MFRKIGLVCAGLAMFSIAGGHWGVLQSVAWARMLVSYAQNSGSLAVAVDQTFDGQHPCPLCQDIAAAKSKAHKDSPATPTERDDAKVKAVSHDTWPRLVQRLADSNVFHGVVVTFVPSRTEAPPTPPPRVSRVAA